MEPSDKTLPRRMVLKVLAVASAASAIDCGGPSFGGPGGDVSAGNVSALPVGALRVAGAGVAIGRDSGGVYAVSLICTHQGCDISSNGSVSPSGIHCGCHGAMFDANGNVLGGPARSPLPHYQVDVDASGNLTIRGNQEIASSARTKV